MRRLLLFLLAVVMLPLAASAQRFHAGVTEWTVHPTESRNWRGAPLQGLRCMLWYPVSLQTPETPQAFGIAGLPALFQAGRAARDAAPERSAAHLPLVVMSHGLGGTADQFGWLAPELARHGYLVLAVNHPGNNALEPYTPEGFLLWGERALDVSDALDALLADKAWGSRVDPARIGALGYSIGGETVLALAGARIDQQAFLDFCTAHPAEQTCRVPSMGGVMGDATAMLAAVHQSSAASLARSGDSFRDARIRSVFALAPAAGQAFHRSSFDYVTIPLTMVAGTADTLAAPAANAEQFAAWLPTAKVAMLPGVGHYSFLDTCTPEGAQMLPQYCADAPGVDRDGVHGKVTAMALAFFERTLGSMSTAVKDCASNACASDHTPGRAPELAGHTLR